MDKDNDKLKYEIMRGFHEQFADNQFKLQQSFIQVLSVILTVLIGYGYVYSNGGTFVFKDIQNYDFTLAFSFCVASLINAFGILLVLSNAHAYRRDQFVVSRIRKKVGLQSVEENDINIFPHYFDPAISFNQKLIQYKKSDLKSFKRLYEFLHYQVSWMPNFYNILVFVLVAFHFGLLISLFLNPNDNFTFVFCFCYDIHWSYVLSFLAWSLLTLYLVERNNSFKRKLARLYSPINQVGNCS
jgi:hypothetical protein